MNRELRNHVLKLISANTRLDGRKFDEYREPVSVEVNVIATAEGSARVKIGDTEVLAGVKVDVMSPYPDTPEEGTIMVGAELLPMSNPGFESGPPGIDAIELARVVDRGIRESKAIDFKKLCIEPGEKVWALLIDVVTVNAAGNLPDASSLAAMAALKSMRFPKYEDEKINHKEKTDQKLEMNYTPINVTVHKIGNTYLVDPTDEEETVSDARLTVASLEDGTLCALQKGGDYPVMADDINGIVDLAQKKATELRAKMDDALKKA